MWSKISVKFVNTQCIKNLNDTFWAMFHRQEKWSKSSKVPPGGGVEIENVT